MSDRNRATIAAELAGIAEDIATLIDTRDSRGALLFSLGDALEIPVNAGLRVAPVASRADIFEGIDTPGGPMDLVAIVSNAAAAVTEPAPGLREAVTRSDRKSTRLKSSHSSATRISSSACKK